jgi:hypothetical protein
MYIALGVLCMCVRVIGLYMYIGAPMLVVYIDDPCWLLATKQAEQRPARET